MPLGSFYDFTVLHRGPTLSILKATAAASGGSCGGLLCHRYGQRVRGARTRGKVDILDVSRTSKLSFGNAIRVAPRSDRCLRSALYGCATKPGRAGLGLMVGSRWRGPPIAGLAERAGARTLRGPIEGAAFDVGRAGARALPRAARPVAPRRLPSPIGATDLAPLRRRE